MIIYRKLYSDLSGNIDLSIPHETILFYLQISVEFVPVPLSATEVRLVEGITDLLSKEPFVVSKNVVEIGNKI